MPKSLNEGCLVAIQNFYWTKEFDSLKNEERLRRLRQTQPHNISYRMPPRTIAFIYFEQWTCHLIRWKKIACCYQIDKILGLQLESFAVWLLICFVGVVVETANCHSKLYSWIFQSKLLCKFLHGSFIFFSTPFLSTQIDNWGMRSSATVYIAYKNRSQPYCNFC